MEEKYAEIIRERIRSLCGQRGISIYQLADMSGISRTTIESFLNKRSNNPRLMTVHKIAHGFSMTLPEFLNFEEFNSFSFEDNTPD